MMISAVIGLVLIQGDSDRDTAGEGTTFGPEQSSKSPDVTAGSSSTSVTDQAHVSDRRDDTTGPDLVNVSASAVHRLVHIEITFAARVSADVVTHLFIDADTDRSTGRLSFPCGSATLGADYEISVHGNRPGVLMSSVGDGCGAAFKPVAQAEITTRVVGSQVRIDVPVRAVRRPGDHVLGLYAQAVRAAGGQIDACPGQHDPSLSVQY
jgi:hypothetical protein